MEQRRRTGKNMWVQLLWLHKLVRARGGPKCAGSVSGVHRLGLGIALGPLGNISRKWRITLFHMEKCFTISEWLGRTYGEDRHCAAAETFGQNHRDTVATAGIERWPSIEQGIPLRQQRILKHLIENYLKLSS